MAQVSYSDALTTLSTMFGDVDHAVIKMVLDSNRGRMERTVEQLLDLSREDAPNKLTDATTLESNESTAPHPENAPTSSSSDLKVFDRLPSDFLRPPSFYAAPEPNQIDSDRQFAQVIQDSLLMSQMRRQPERFMYPASRAAQSSSAAVDEAPISERLAQLGDKARQKLAALGARFQRRQQARDQHDESSNTQSRYANLDDADDSSLLTREPDSSFSIGDPDGSVELQDMRFPGGHPTNKTKPSDLQPL